MTTGVITMSLTKKTDNRVVTLQFVETHLKPLFASGQVFPRWQPGEDSSYFVRRKKRRMTREDFESADFDTGEEFGDKLSELWKNNQRIPEGLGAATGALANDLRSDSEQNGELSEFIYTMF